MQESQGQQEGLHHTEDLYRRLIDEMQDYAIFIVDREGRIITWNASAERILGYRQAEITGRHISVIFMPEDIARGEPETQLKRAAADGRVADARWQVRRGGERFWATGTTFALRNQAGELLGFAKLLRDDTERRRIEEERDRFFMLSADMLCVVNLSGYFERANPGFEKTLGYTPEELLASPIPDFLHPADQAALMSAYASLATGSPITNLENRWRCKDGSYKWVDWSYFPVVEEGIAYGVGRDVTERKASEERYRHDAFHDPLTGLANRALFMDHLNLAAERAKRHEGYLYAVLLLDLDYFKTVNDTFGHIVGDQLLVGVARRLETVLRPSDTFARFGGDEFTILLDSIRDVNEAVHVTERIQQQAMLPFHLSGHEVFTSVSVGVALNTTGYNRPESLMRDADAALYRAKSAGRARHEVFDSDMHKRATNLLHLEIDLRRAIERQEFRLHYQPIVLLPEGSICGFEALLRWQHPKRGLVLPAEFISVAEETGMILPLGQWVLDTACRQMSQWQQRYSANPPLSISVNMCSRQFTQPNLIKQIDSILHQTNLAPRSLKLEVTESVVMENTKTVTETLLQLRALGVELNIDDFGTGYSSLSYLHNFFVGALKIDQSFISRMTGNGNSEIVQAIITLAHNLGIEVVAEGVETNEQRAQLSQMRCKYGQGYLFSKPVDAEAASRLIEQALPISGEA